MPLAPSLLDLSLRLFLTMLAGMLIGYDRSERGHEAGLRTTTLVCLAACIAMIEANLLLPVSGKQPGSFSEMDVMRLPLGILSGMGFIGAGAILRRGERVSGVTTAATLWAVTVVGLCFGSGQLWLGALGTGLIWSILFLVKRLDLRMEREQKAILIVGVASAHSIEVVLRDALTAAGVRTRLIGVRCERERAWSELTCQIRWKAPFGARDPNEIAQRLLQIPEVSQIDWKQDG